MVRIAEEVSLFFLKSQFLKKVLHKETTPPWLGVRSEIGVAILFMGVTVACWLGLLASCMSLLAKEDPDSVESVELDIRRPELGAGGKSASIKSPISSSRT